MMEPRIRGEEPENGKPAKKAALLCGITVAAVFAVTTLLLWKPLAATFQHPEQFRAWVDAHGLLGQLAFVGMDMLQVIFAFLPGEPMELGAGYAFGTWKGAALCLMGDAIATAIVFLSVKRFGRRLAEAFVSREKMMSVPFLQDGKRMHLTLFILFLIPGTPKDVFTYVMGLTPTTLWKVLLITSVARIPSVLTSTIAGNALGAQDYRCAIWVYSVTAVCSIAGILIYRAICKRQRKSAP